jgi:Domain of unknown function (DUF4345)/Domain of unknown function (DUF4267)
MSPWLVSLPGILFFAGMGLLALARPNLISQMFGVTQSTTESRTEVRSVYGGFGLAMALALLWALRSNDAEARGIFLAIGLAWLGWATGRLLGALMEWPKRFYPTWFFVCLEFLLAALTLWARSLLVHA